jgi:predicted TIM-barrel fold metal-dependent hydrolase
LIDALEGAGLKVICNEPDVIDAHFHAFDRRLPRCASARYQPAYDALIEQLQVQWREHGITRGVMVQPSFLGTDNTYLLQICEQFAQILRGVVVVSSDISEPELERMHRQGVRGIRFNWLGLTPWPDLTGSEWLRVRSSIKTLGWHVQLHVEGERLAQAASHFETWELPLVIDHLGRPASMQTVDAHIATVLAIARRRPTQIKISAPYRCARGEKANSFVQISQALLSELGVNHLLWGSDWPFTQHETFQSFDSVWSAFELACPQLGERQSIMRNAEQFYFP